MVTTRAQWSQQTSGSGAEESQTQRATSGGGGGKSQGQRGARDQSSGSKGGRNARGRKRVVEEEEETETRDEVVRNEPKSRSRNARKRQALSPDVSEGPSKMATQREPASGRTRGKKGGARTDPPAIVPPAAEKKTSKKKGASKQPKKRSRGRPRKQPKEVPVLLEGTGRQKNVRPRQSRSRQQKEKPIVVESEAESAGNAGSSSTGLRIPEEKAGAVVELRSDNSACMSEYKTPSSFFSENVENWKYSGRVLKTNLGDTAEQIRYKNKLWCEIKALSRKMIDLQVESENDDPNDPVKRLKFKVSSFASKTNRPNAAVAVNHFATIHVTFNPNVDISFVFTLDNRDLAEKCEVTVQILRTACERVFQTLVLRCETKDGYNKYEDPEYLEKLLADANALEMPVSPPPERAESGRSLAAETEEGSRAPTPESQEKHSEASELDLPSLEHSDESESELQSQEHSEVSEEAGSQSLDGSEESDSQGEEEEDNDVDSTFGLV